VFEEKDFDCKKIIEGTIEELSIYNDPVFIVELLDVYISRYSKDNQELNEKILTSLRESLKRSEIALHYLNIVESRMLIQSGNFEKAMQVHKLAESKLESMREIPKVVFFTLQLTKSIFYWQTKDFNNYFSVAMNFMPYLEVHKFSESELKALAEQVIQAALINKETLVFGVLADNALFGVLKKFDQSVVLLEMLEMFKRGKADEFEHFIRVNSFRLSQFPLMCSNVDKLSRKIRVIAFYDFVFYNQTSNLEPLGLTFDQIASVAKIESSEVEKLIVYVLSIGIFEGFADSIERKLYVSRIKPQELDLNRQIQLRENFVQWKSKIGQAIGFIKSC
jgi:hypothetical protein